VQKTGTGSLAFVQGERRSFNYFTDYQFFDEHIVDFPVYIQRVVKRNFYGDSSRPE